MTNKKAGAEAPSTQKIIELWYRDANDLATRLLPLIRCRSFTLRNSISVTDDPTPEEIRQRYRDANAQADAEQDAVFEKVNSIRLATGSLAKRYDAKWTTAFYFDLRDFEIESLPCGRCVWPVLMALACKVADWGQELAGDDTAGRLSEVWQERERWLAKAVDAIRARLMLEESRLLGHALLVLSDGDSTPEVSKRKATRKRRKKGEGGLTDAQEKFAAAIRDWHGFESESLSVTKMDAISYDQLCDTANVAGKASATTFFNVWFQVKKDGNKRYQALCKRGNAKALAIEIAKLSREGALNYARLTVEAVESQKAKTRKPLAE